MLQARRGCRLSPAVKFLRACLDAPEVYQGVKAVLDGAPNQSSPGQPEADSSSVIYQGTDLPILEDLTLGLEPSADASGADAQPQTTA